MKLGDVEIEKQNLQQHKKPISINMQILMKQQYLRKSCLVKRVLNISLATNMLKNNPFRIFFLITSGNRKDLDETRYMSPSIKDGDLLEKYNEIREKVSKSIKKNLIVNLHMIKNM